MPLGPFFLLLLIAEVVALVVCLKTIGFLSTLGLIFLSLLIGAWLLQRQGLATLERMASKLEFGAAPMEEGWDGACIMGAAFLFMLPGLVSDALALLLLIPPVRRLLWVMLQKSGRVEGNFFYDSRAIKPSRANIEAEVVEAEWHEVTNDQAGPRT